MCVSGVGRSFDRQRAGALRSNTLHASEQEFEPLRNRVTQRTCTAAFWLGPSHAAAVCNGSLCVVRHVLALCHSHVQECKYHLQVPVPAMKRGTSKQVLVRMLQQQKRMPHWDGARKAMVATVREGEYYMRKQQEDQNFRSGSRCMQLNAGRFRAQL